MRPRIVSGLERMTGASFLVLGDPCYGACDLPTDFRDYADAIVQFGHSDSPGIVNDEKALFIEVFMDIKMDDLLDRALPDIMKRVGLITTVQHIRMLPEIRSWLEKRNIQVWIGSGDGRIKFDGQVLGCNVSVVDSIVDKVDQFVYVGSGNFHPLSVAIETKKPVLVLDPI